ncbi:MAG TPA: cupin domain-containing protein, partial [Niastella sp.]
MRPIFLTIIVLTSLFAAAQQGTITSKVFGWKSLAVEKDTSSSFMKVANGATATLANLDIKVVELEPGKTPHSMLSHADAEELIVVKDGNLKVTTSSTSTIIGPGGVALIMPGDAHTFENTG